MNGSPVTYTTANIKQHGHKTTRSAQVYSRTGRSTGSSLDRGRDCTCDPSRPDDGCDGYAFMILANVAGTAGGCCSGGSGVGFA